MTDYSDLILLIGAMVIYGLMVTNTNRTLVMNSQILTTSEVEYGAISAAEEIIGEIRLMSYDKIKTTDENTLENNLEALNTNNLYEVDVEIEETNIDESSFEDKKFVVTVNSEYLVKGENNQYSITMSYIKTDY